MSDSAQAAATIADQAKSVGANIILFAHDEAVKNIAPRVAARLDS